MRAIASRMSSKSSKVRKKMLLSRPVSRWFVRTSEVTPSSFSIDVIIDPNSFSIPSPKSGSRMKPLGRCSRRRPLTSASLAGRGTVDALKRDLPNLTILWLEKAARGKGSDRVDAEQGFRRIYRQQPRFWRFVIDLEV